MPSFSWQKCVLSLFLFCFCFVFCFCSASESAEQFVWKLGKRNYRKTYCGLLVKVCGSCLGWFRMFVSDTQCSFVSILLFHMSALTVNLLVIHEIIFSINCNVWPAKGSYSCYFVGSCQTMKLCITTNNCYPMWTEMSLIKNIAKVYGKWSPYLNTFIKSYDSWQRKQNRTSLLRKTQFYGFIIIHMKRELVVMVSYTFR